MKLRTLVGLGVGYVIGSQFGPERIQRMLTSLASQDETSEPAASTAGLEASDVSWPDPEFQP